MTWNNKDIHIVFILLVPLFVYLTQPLKPISLVCFVSPCYIFLHHVNGPQGVEAHCQEIIEDQEAGQYAGHSTIAALELDLESAREKFKDC